MDDGFAKYFRLFSSRKLTVHWSKRPEKKRNLFPMPGYVSTALLNIGNCRIKKGNFDESLLSYQEALRITPRVPAVLKNISVLKRLSGE